MPEGLIEAAARRPEPEDRRIEGVTIAQVINNIDLMGAARVQLRLPWLPGLEPWARVATPSAGSERGAYFIPQVGDEVVVAFNHGDIRDPYVLGSLWNRQDRPPTAVPTDAVTKRIIHSPLGHDILLDDAEQTITVTSITKHKVTMAPQKIELTTAGGTAKVTLDSAGKISLTANVSLEIKAPTISIQGTTVELKGTASATIDGGATCTVRGGVVKVN